MAPASIVFPDPLFRFQNPDENDEQRFHCTYLVCTSQETHYVSTTKPNQFILFRETVAVYCENHTEHTDTLCAQNVEFWYVNPVRTSQETYYVSTT
jgi:hypothetical protein